MSDMHTLVHI